MWYNWEYSGEVIFMHMADALVSPAVAGTMATLSTVTTIYSINKVREQDDLKKVPLMGVMGAFVFAAQMINFTIPGTGSSGHLCGGMLVSALLGPEAGFLTMVSVLAVQALLFADGGLLALGCNIWNMAFYGCFLGSLIWKFVMRKGMDTKKIVLASVLGCVLTLQLGSFSVCLETLASGITELPFTAFVALMQPIHLLIGTVEGCITAAVLCFIYNARGELLVGYDGKDIGISMKKLIMIMSVITLFIGGGLSLVASSNPDGLEWAMEKVAGTSELEHHGGVHETSSHVQEITSVLPDYGFKDEESTGGTMISGVLGSVIVAVVCLGISYLVRRKRETA